MEDTTGYFVYDHLTYEPLAELGWDVVEIPWDRPGIDWSQFQAVVIRSTWNYQTQAERFLEILDEIDQSGTKLFNPVDICRWNLDKRYLKDLERKDVPIVPTLWPEGLNEESIQQGFQYFNVDRLVVKPIVGANADDTYILSQHDPQSWDVGLRIFAQRPLLMQPFLSTIQTEGECSLFYFGNQYSHAVLKLPKSGDFRVQEEHGGQLRAIDPTTELLAAGQQAVDQLGQRLLYARVDFVNWEGMPYLIEAELIEPSLYFPYAPESPKQFAQTLDAMVRPAPMPSRSSMNGW